MREEGALGTIAVETVSRPRVCWVVLSIDSPTLCIIPSGTGGRGLCPPSLCFLKSEPLS